MTCGYVCPQCEGRGVLESGEICDYCSKPIEMIEKFQESNQENHERTERKA
jgi:hypothetical protein